MRIFDEVEIGGLKLKNRLVMAPMGTIHGEDGSIDDAQRAYLVERAKGGFGLIYPSAHSVSGKFDPPLYTGNHLHTAEQAQKLTVAVEQVHQYGAKFALQLTPGYGRVCVAPPAYMQHISASENTVFIDPAHKCRPLTGDEIHELVYNAGVSAAMAKMAHVDVIEVHAYGGYLLDQFLSKCWNRREDEYGGSLENRMRFLMEFYGAIRAAVGPDFPVSIKYTVEHHISGGRTFEDEGIEIARILDQMGFAYIHLDDGCYERWNHAIPSAYEVPGSQLFVAERLRKEGIKTPFLIQGKLNYPAIAEEVIDSGTADLIALGHQSLADPYWPRKVKQRRFEDINHCICCGECLNSSNPIEGMHRFSCAINPRTGMERFYEIPNVVNKHKLLVVGGGPGGMYAAILAAKLGHDVALWERGDRLGGLMKAASAPDFKCDMKKYLENQIAQVHKYGVKLSLLKEGTVESIEEYGADAVILACGARQTLPPIPGIEGNQVITAYSLLAEKRPVGNKVLVIGGGHVGCEAALYLDEMGKDVSVVEMGTELLESSGMSRNQRFGLKEKLENSGITQYTSSTVRRICPGSVELLVDGEERTVACDTVVLAAGFHSDDALGNALEERGIKVFTIGDNVKPGKVYHAVHGAYHTIRLLDDLLENS